VTTLAIMARGYAGEQDLPLIAEMLNHCEDADQTGESSSVDELRQEFATPHFDPARDLQLWEDGDGALIGFGQLWIHNQATDPDSFLWYRVRPAARDGDLDEQIIAWAAERTRAAAQERGVRLRLRVSAISTEQARIDLLERSGFATDRYFYRMACPLEGPLAEPQLPAGFTVATGPYDAEMWARLFNESFIDHWNHQPISADEVTHQMSDPVYQPHLDLVAYAPDGRPAAFCWGSINIAENQRSGRNDGQIGLLGTRRGFRKIGLGRAMLLTGMRALKAAGADMAKLGVDADSPTGATRLYESVGFRVELTRRLFGRDVA
jgi:mycothiol synthase